MTDKELYSLKFPIGEFQKPSTISNSQISTWITEIESFPQSVKEVIQNLSIEQLNWRYRPEGWAIKQVVHHCADSHMNSIIRFKLSLTEDTPIIKPYFEDRWAELTDSLNDDISSSLTLLTGLHSKWVILLNSLSDQDLKKEFIHPEHGKKFSLEETIGTYAWHSNHHLAHIKQAVYHKGKFN